MAGDRFSHGTMLLKAFLPTAGVATIMAPDVTTFVRGMPAPYGPIHCGAFVHFLRFFLSTQVLAYHDCGPFQPCAFQRPGGSP